MGYSSCPNLGGSAATNEVFQLAEERGIGTHTAAQLLAELRIERAKAEQMS